MDNIFNTVNSSDKRKSGTSKIAEIEKSSRHLFEDLCEEKFNEEQFVKELKAYLKKIPRVYYSGYSKIIFSSDEEKRGVLDTNLESLVDFTGCEEFDKLFPKGTPDYGDKKNVERVIFKLWDHSRLAENQIDEIKNDSFFEKFKPEKEEIESNIKKEGQKLNRELITLVGIFTAMAFLVFGGLNSLSGILENSVKGVPILNISVVSLLWGLCVYNMIYLFMFLVSKLTGNDIATDSQSPNIFRRHLIYFLGNAVLLSALCVSGWLYFIKIDFRGWYSKLYGCFQWLTPFLCLAFPIVLAVLFVILFLTNKKASNAKPDSAREE